MNKVKIIPQSQRARNRVKEHGEVMEIVDEDSNKFLARSIQKTWKGPNNVMQVWLGWFNFDEAYYIEL